MRKLFISLLMAGLLALLTLATAVPAFAAPGDLTRDDPSCTADNTNAGHDLDGDATDNTSVDGGPGGPQCFDGNSEAAP